MATGMLLNGAGPGQGRGKKRIYDDDYGVKVIRNYAVGKTLEHLAWEQEESAVPPAKRPRYEVPEPVNAAPANPPAPAAHPSAAFSAKLADPALLKEQETLRILRNWITSHSRYPYPAPGETRALAREAGITERAVTNWLTVLRRQLADGDVGLTLYAAYTRIRDPNEPRPARRHASPPAAVVPTEPRAAPGPIYSVPSQSPSPSVHSGGYASNSGPAVPSPTPSSIVSPAVSRAHSVSPPLPASAVVAPVMPINPPVPEPPLVEPPRAPAAPTTAESALAPLRLQGPPTGFRASAPPTALLTTYAERTSLYQQAAQAVTIAVPVESLKAIKIEPDVVMLDTPIPPAPASKSSAVRARAPAHAPTRSPFAKPTAAPRAPLHASAPRAHQHQSSAPAAAAKRPRVVDASPLAPQAAPMDTRANDLARRYQARCLDMASQQPAPPRPASPPVRSLPPPPAPVATVEPVAMELVQPPAVMRPAPPVAPAPASLPGTSRASAFRAYDRA